MIKIKKIILIFITFVGIIFISKSANAASITASPSSPKKGQSVTITVSVPNVNTVDLTATISGAGTNGTIRLVDGSMTGEAKTFSKSITVTPTTKGTISVKISSSSNAVLNGQYVDVSGTKNITVTEPEPEQSKPSTSGGSGSTSSSGSTSKPSTTTKPSTTSKPSTSEEKETKKSSDSTLKLLSVKEGAITPEFNKDVREYTLTVPNEIEEINITAEPTDSKATATVSENKGLKEGENTVTISVVAEDGSSSKYLIRVTRARPVLALQSLVIKYKNQEGNLVEVLLNPVFNFQTYEYTLDNLEYWVEKLEIEAIANIEGATLEVEGADYLKEGENIVTITVKIPMQVAEGEEPQDEIKTYTIKFNKNEKPEPPTLMGRISNWFNGMFGGVASWYNTNQEKVILGALGACIIALVGLSIYIILDYYKYKDVIAKLKNINEMNYAETQIETTGKVNNVENIYNEKQAIDHESNKKDKPKGGRRFLE